MWILLSGIYLGGTLGANDAANVFGTAVTTHSIKFKTAIALSIIFIPLGAYLEGAAGMETLGALADQTLWTAFSSSLAAALTMTLMTIWKLPTSTSQAVVGAIIGSSFLRSSVNFSPLKKITLAWFFTPIGALIIAYSLYKIYLAFVEPHIKNIVHFEFYIKTGLIISGIYGAYSLGANNVANVMVVYVEADLFDPQVGSLIGGISIAIGTLFSRRVMQTVGSKLTLLTPLTALIALLAHSLTLYSYAKIGIPVSSSQAIVGGVIGVGLVKGAHMLDWETAKKILFGWVGTPITAGIIGMLLSKLF
jgi:PiT family inorganic phosphate transporter